MPLNNDDLRAALRAIEDKTGRLTPEAVVKEARNKNHPLHGEFTWQNDVAANEWRLSQARALIRRVHVVVSTEERIVRAPAYLHDPSTPQQSGYISAIKIKADEGMSRDALIAEFKAAGGHVRRARDIAAFLGMESEVEPLVRQFDAVFQTISGEDGRA